MRLLRVGGRVLEGGEGRGGVALAEADGEGPEGQPQHGQYLGMIISLSHYYYYYI